MNTLERYEGVVFGFLLLYVAHHYLSSKTQENLEDSQVDLVHSSNVNVWVKVNTVYTVWCISTLTGTQFVLLQDREESRADQCANNVG